MAKLSDVRVTFKGEHGYTVFEWTMDNYIYIHQKWRDNNDAVTIFGGLSMLKTIVKNYEEERGILYTKSVERTYKSEE